MWFFENNYTALSAMLDETQLLRYGAVTFEVADSLVALSIVENTRYTLLVRLSQKFRTSGDFLKDISFDVRLYQDAKLAEVLSYQGRARIKFRYNYPNKHMFVPDEKQQGNLLLHDWLSMCRRLNYKETIIENCQQ